LRKPVLLRHRLVEILEAPQPGQRLSHASISRELLVLRNRNHQYPPVNGQAFSPTRWLGRYRHDPQ
jgi:hypothetical protein